MASSYNNLESASVLPEDVPVTMPDLPARLTVNTAQQFKALGDPLRSRILGIIRHQPATAKQLADRLKVAPGTVGHHLQVLEAAGLAQVVARRLIHGITAKYYTRTARIFAFDFPPEVSSNTAIGLDIITKARDELAESLSTAEASDASCKDPLPYGRYQSGFPHARLSPERAEEYSRRLQALIDDFVDEAPNPDSDVYGLFVALFVAPPYLQGTSSANPEEPGNPSQEE